jgi:hypothetical protein
MVKVIGLYEKLCIIVGMVKNNKNITKKLKTKKTIFLFLFKKQKRKKKK